MNNLANAIVESFRTLPSWVIWAVSLPLMLSVPLGLVKWMCELYGSARRRPIPKTAEKGKDDSTAPKPCPIHDDCTDCGFYGTGYCWKVLKYE